MTGRKIAPICRVLGIGRASAYRGEKPRGPRYVKADDRVVTAQIREVIRTRATYGSRRTCALVNRAFGTSYNGKRVRRVMDIAGWTLPRSARRRTGRLRPLGGPAEAPDRRSERDGRARAPSGSRR